MSELLGQISMFSLMPEEEWRIRALRGKLRGGKCGLSSSRIRIYTAVTKLDKDRLEDYIQNEYGISGGSVEDGTVNFNCRGAEMYNFKTKEFTRVPWCRIRDMIVQMVNDGEYLTEEDKERIRQIRQENSGTLPLMPPDGIKSMEEGSLTWTTGTA